MIFKAKHGRFRERSRCNDAGDDAGALFFRGKTSRDGIKAVRLEPFFRVGVELDRVAALHAVPWPLRGVVDEMARISPHTPFGLGLSGRFAVGNAGDSPA